ncbi:MAG: snapalysin family zinc-dependent metalloprotease [Gaiellales bacterium]
MPARADAYVISGKRWPGKTITYSETLPPSWDWSVQQAVKTWNTSGVRVRFVRARSRASAQVVIRFGPTAGNAGLASIGAQPNAYVHMYKRSVLPVQDRVAASMVIAHELGHVVGLDHTRARGCNLMNTYTSGPGCPESPRVGYYWCRWLSPDDLRGALRLYGGRARTQPKLCLHEPRPPKLLNVKVSGGAQAGAPVRLTWKRPKGLRSSARIQVSVHAAGKCSSWKIGEAFENVLLRSTATSWTDSKPRQERGPGSYCYRVQALNQFQLGGPAINRVADVWRPAPPAPVITALTEYPDDYSDYTFEATLPEGAALEGRSLPGTTCPASREQGDVVAIYAQSGTTWSISALPTGQHCLSLFTVDAAGTSSLPSAPQQLNHVERVYDNGDGDGDGVY